MIWADLRPVRFPGVGQAPRRLSQRGIAPLSRRAGISPGSVRYMACSILLSNHAVRSTALTIAFYGKPRPSGRGG